MPTKLPGDLGERSPLPQRLVRARIAAGLSQAQVAQRSGLRENYIAQLETDKFGWPAPDKLEAWGRALGIPYEELQSLPYARRGQDDAPPPPPLPRRQPDPRLEQQVLADLRRRLPHAADATLAAFARAAALEEYLSREELEARAGPTKYPSPAAPEHNGTVG